MVHGGINIYRLKDNATRTVLVRVAFFAMHPEKLPVAGSMGIAAVYL